MPVAQSFEELFQQGLAEMQARRGDLAINDGDVTEADLHAAAAMADAVIRYAALAFKETFIDGATEDRLTSLVYDHLGITRNPATAAQVTLTFARSGGDLDAGTIPSGTTVATSFDPGGKQLRYTTDAPINVPDGDDGPFTVAATCTVVGAAGNAAAGKVEKIVDVLFDTFTVTNAAAAAGGNEQEGDEDLRRRAKNFFATLRRGTRAALEQGALEVDEVRVATVVENAEEGTVTVLVGDSDGNSTAEMIEAVEFELENWRAAGVFVAVAGASQKPVAMTLSFDVRDGFDIVAVLPTIEDALIARSKKQRASQTLTLDTIVATVIGLYPDDIFKVDFDSIVVDGETLVTPADITAEDGEVIRITSVTMS
jgi:uncharacterized phage protein gp47/JayE